MARGRAAKDPNRGTFGLLGGIDFWQGRANFAFAALAANQGANSGMFRFVAR